MKAWSLNKKISIGSAVLLTGVAVALLYNAYYVAKSVRMGLEAERDLMFQGFRGQLSQMRESEVVYSGVVHGALLQLQSQVEKNDPIILNSKKLIEVSKGVQVPSLEVNGNELTNNFTVVDHIKEKFGGSATIFVRKEKDFVRISTNVIKDDGSRAVGTNLSPEGPAYKALINGDSFFGQATILGKPYFTGYVPIFSKDKEIIGAWYVGYILKSLISTLEFIEKEKILTNGFITLYKIENGKAKLLVSKDNPILQNEAYVQWLDRVAETNLELSDWEFTKSLEDGGYLLVSAIHKEDVSSKVINTTLSSNGFMVFVILMLLGGVIFFAKSLERTLSRVTSEADTVGGTVAETAGQMTLTGKKLSEGAVSAAASIEETVASLEELVSMVSRNAESAKSANGLTEDARDLTKKGEENIHHLMKAMTDIQESSRKVSDIVAIIDDIAFQTNLLALNASVEAARAGDHGKGFAVVADAVRSLALKSAEAANDIKKLIQESVEKSTGGGQIAQASVVSFEEVSNSIQKLTFIVGEISTASEEQSLGLKQISSAMNQLDQVTQANATAAQESAHASEELNANAVDLSEVVKEMKILIKGAS